MSNLELSFEGFSPRDFDNFVQNGTEAINRAIKYTALEVNANVKIEAPKDHGRLAGSFQIEQLGDKEWNIFTNVIYSLFVQQGTGVYGPNGQPIRPTQANALFFFYKAIGQDVFAKEVKGQKPNPYVDRALNKTKNRAQEFITRAIQEVMT